MRGAVLRVLLAFVVLVVTGLGWTGWRIHSRLHPEPPDVAAVAGAAPTLTAHQQAAAFSDLLAAQLRAATPWAAFQDSSVADLCRTVLVAPRRSAAPQWSPVGCSRTTVVYVAFDGDLEQRLADLDRTMVGLRWTPGPSDGSDPGAGLVRQLHRDGPNSVAVHHHPTGAPPDDPAAAVLTVAVADRPAAGSGLPLVPGSWDDWHGVGDADGRPDPGRPNRSDRAVVLDWRRVDGIELSARAHARHRYLAAFGLSQVYTTV
ncbi:hypothetical protein [Kitasatospora sp. NPDC002040]|uniref:hypothetical protein n=1 Tax=Kitasatospora sp. NPDC002040 TaxID=3154661 RepID=UPI00331BD814